MVIHSRSVQFYGYKFDAIAVFHCSVIMHCFQKLVSDIGTFFIYVQIKTGIEFALVCEHKDIAFLFWDIFCGACGQWGKFASIMRKGRNFSHYTNANFLH